LLLAVPALEWKPVGQEEWEKAMRNQRGKARLKTILAILVSILGATSAVKAGALAGSVLYPLIMPSGFSNIYEPGGPQIVAIGQVVGTVSGSSAPGGHAMLWSGPAGNAVDLNPTNLAITKSGADGTNGTQQVGFGNGPATGNNTYAMLWNGTAGSAVDLNPTNLGVMTNTVAFSTDGVQQVGEGTGPGTGSSFHALLWNGTAASAVDLNPTSLGITYSQALAISGGQQVGGGYGGSTGGNNHALLWFGTAASAVDLQPTNLSYMTGSNAFGTNGIQQVGDGEGASFFAHALLWSGTADSAVDLNPTNLTYITDSIALGTSGTQQVGWGEGSGTGGNSHALLWSDTAASAVDLQTLLPSAGNWKDSTAYIIDASGDVFGTADGTYNHYTGSFAVEWSPVVGVPEPASLCILAVGATGLLRRPQKMGEPQKTQ
jgi:hypothetical protein